ncbi:hypothetical protein IW261DRAFT_5929 [Armillaria novae-zelandiae]|uniref:Uncharacterized protein n=1 Tax=Armillaria novae-zelandiae TaxID=153914 RepID=A0AA39PWB6_9AGAR|nr:hypothetical protein IW261DRAFT_5929 [Armillaria novae-zelandiae]
MTLPATWTHIYIFLGKMAAGISSWQRQHPSIPPILVILLFTLLKCLLSLASEVNAFMKIVDRILIFCNKILTISLILFATTKL